MTAPEVLAALLAGIGAVLVLDGFSAVRRPSLARRLAPHRLVAPRRRDQRGPLALLAPTSARLADAVLGSLGVDEPLPVRLRRARRHDPSAHRIREARAAGLGALAAVIAVAALRPPIVVAAAVEPVAALLALLLVEQDLARAGRRHGDRVGRELPVVAEQLGILLSSGWSLTAALARVAARGSGAVALDLGDVNRRIHQGVEPVAALREWSDVVGVDGARRLVGVLALHGHTNDLAGLIETEARTIRQEAHRDLLARLEQRTQQVWVPVTVATLVPGILLLAVPFVDALSEFGSL